VRTTGAPVSVSETVAAAPDVLYGLVADVTRMGEWSPENEGGTWLGGATTATPGARFRSQNRVGKRSWKTVATVVGGATYLAERIVYRRSVERQRAIGEPWAYRED